MSLTEGPQLHRVGPLLPVLVPGHRRYLVEDRTLTGEMAAELLALVNSGTIRVIDILILTKNKDGVVEATEFSDSGELGELQALQAQLAD